MSPLPLACTHVIFLLRRSPLLHRSPPTSLSLLFPSTSLPSAFSAPTLSPMTSLLRHHTNGGRSREFKCGAAAKNHHRGEKETLRFFSRQHRCFPCAARVCCCRLVFMCWSVCACVCVPVSASFGGLPVSTSLPARAPWSFSISAAACVSFPARELFPPFLSLSVPPPSLLLSPFLPPLLLCPLIFSLEFPLCLPTLTATDRSHNSAISRKQTKRSVL